MLLGTNAKGNDSILIDLSTPLRPLISVPIEATDQGELSISTAQKILTIHLINQGHPLSTPLFGTYTIRGNRLVFEPIYALQMESSFKVIYHHTNGTSSKVFSTPRRKQIGQFCHVLQIYPQSYEIPQNTCFFHVQFDQPMQNFKPNEVIKMLDQKGNRIDQLWRVQAYWLNNKTSLVLMVHPGRLKRGIDWEIPFKEGEEYTLLIDTNLKSSYNCPLKNRIKKTFKITPPDRQSPSILFDKLTPPTIASKAPLSLLFSEKMDYGSIIDGVKVINTQTQKIVHGNFRVVSDQNFKFIPNKAWENAPYKVVFEKMVCDLANNRINRVFEVLTIEEKKKDWIPVEWLFRPTPK